MAIDLRGLDPMASTWSCPSTTGSRRGPPYAARRAPHEPTRTDHRCSPSPVSYGQSDGHRVVAGAVGPATVHTWSSTVRHRSAALAEHRPSRGTRPRRRRATTSSRPSKYSRTDGRRVTRRRLLPAVAGAGATPPGRTSPPRPSPSPSAEGGDTVVSPSSSGRPAASGKSSGDRRHVGPVLVLRRTSARRRARWWARRPRRRPSIAVDRLRARVGGLGDAARPRRATRRRSRSPAARRRPGRRGRRGGPVPGSPSKS